MQGGGGIVGRQTVVKSLVHPPFSLAGLWVALTLHRMGIVMLKIFAFTAALWASNPAWALAESGQHFAIAPSQAALIAQRSVPGAVVLNVRSLPSGQYVVTMRAGNNVLRVTVNAANGAVN